MKNALLFLIVTVFSPCLTMDQQKKEEERSRMIAEALHNSAAAQVHHNQAFGQPINNVGGLPSH